MSHMAYFNLAIAFFLLVAMAMMLGRLLLGPTLYDRVLAVNSFGTKIVLFLCVFCFIIGRPDGLDIAILYALMNFIATIAVLKFFRYRALDVSLADAHIDEDVRPQTKRKVRRKPARRRKAKKVSND